MAVVAPPTRPSIQVIKTMTYRGNTGHTWSNRYFLNGISSLTTTTATEIMDAIAAQEPLIYFTDQKITQMVAYNPGSDVPLLEKTYNVVGEAVLTGANPSPGDAAAVARFKTTQRTSKNHPVYLFKYWHGVWWAQGGSPDDILPAQRTLFDAYAQKWVQGIVYGGGAGTVTMCGPYGAVAQDHLILQNLRHRDFT